MLLSMLVFTISENDLVGLMSSRDVWVTLENMFCSQSHARVIFLTRYNLTTLKKGHLSINDYFQRAKGFADLLSSIGQPLGLTETTTYILTGRPTEDDSIAPSLNTHLEDCSLDELYGHILTHELCLDQQTINPDMGSPATNFVTRGPSSNTQGCGNQSRANNYGNRNHGRVSSSRGQPTSQNSFSSPSSFTSCNFVSKLVIPFNLVGIGLIRLLSLHLLNDYKHLWPPPTPLWIQHGTLIQAQIIISLWILAT